MELKLTRLDLELVENVYTDLLYVRENANKNNSRTLRKISVDLRKLIVDDLLIRCWKVLKISDHQPIVIANYADIETIRSFRRVLVGSSTIGGAEIKFLSIAIDSPDSEMIRFEENRLFPLSEFKQSCVLVVNGLPISREQIVKYVAHKKGGAHFDGNRREKDSEFKMLDTVVGEKVGGSIRFENGKPMNEGGLSFVYAALLSIAQNIVSSPDVISLLDLCGLIVSHYASEFE